MFHAKDLKTAKLGIDPERCPAVLDTATWNHARALHIVESVKGWRSANLKKIYTCTDPVRIGRCTLYPGSHARFSLR
jgi:hypothetical protein